MELLLHAWDQEDSIWDSFLNRSDDRSCQTDKDKITTNFFHEDEVCEVEKL